MLFKEVESFYFDALAELGVNSADIKRSGEFDIACKCPVCGDSQYGNKKRLHLYQKGEVINVNCFNGDCRVKNMTPWKFFSEFVPRTFAKFKQFNRQKYLNEISTRVKKHKDDITSKTEDWDLWESEPTELMKFIESFERTTRSNDLIRIKSWLKENPDSIEEFRFLMQ